MPFFRNLISLWTVWMLIIASFFYPGNARDANASDQAGLAGQAAPVQQYNEGAAAAVSVLHGWFNGNLYDHAGWWNSANALGSTLDYMKASGSTAYMNDITAAFAVNHIGNFQNYYYDDEGWWALTWVKAYDLTGNNEYLSMARSLFQDMSGGWDSTYGGGIWWNKDRNYKNAIANELFLLLAASLHNRVPGDGFYYDWANREWNWFRASGLINRSNLINDGLTRDGKNNGDATWTYNQGVILGALVELNGATHDPHLLDEAKRIADAVLNSGLVKNGILTEACESCEGDAPQFKGVFMRNLKILNDRVGNPSYQKFLQINANSILSNDQNASHQFGKSWQGPFDWADTARQSSALDLLTTEVTPGNQMDLAKNKAVLANGTACASAEQSNLAVDDSYSSKWCQGGAGGQSLTVDLGSVQPISQIELEHAGAGGEDPAYNTRDYDLQVSTDGRNFTTVAAIWGNLSNRTLHDFSKTNARFVRLNIITAQSAANFQAARIYELKVR